jgi:hypothetical protein
MAIFDTECFAYSWLIPKLQKIRADKNLQPLCFPKCYYSSAPDLLLLLENMKAQNYDVVAKKPERKPAPG